MIIQKRQRNSLVIRTVIATACCYSAASPAIVLAQHSMLPTTSYSATAYSATVNSENDNSSWAATPSPANTSTSTVDGIVDIENAKPENSVKADIVSRSRTVAAYSSAGSSSGRNGLPPKGSWTLTAEAVFADFDDASGLIGSANAPASIGPYSAADFRAFNGAQVGAATLSPQLIGQSASSDRGIGWRAALDYRSETNGGFQLEGMMIDNGDQSFRRGVGGLNAGADLNTVRVGAALPLGVPGGTGYAIPYDQFFGVELETSVDSISAMFAPAGYYYGSIRLQPTLGFRYLRVDQDLNFAAAGSGQSWTPNPDGTRDLTAATATVSAPYQTLLNSSSETNLFGPVIGVNTTTTGSLIRLNSNVRAGVLIADEDVSVAGRGFGRATDAGFDPLLTFSDSKSDTSGTFMLESQLGIDIHIFQLLSKLNRRQFRSSLVLRLGWSILYLDQIAKVEDSVRWNGFPATPTARRQRSDFIVNSFTVGAVLTF